MAKHPDVRGRGAVGGSSRRALGRGAGALALAAAASLVVVGSAGAAQDGVISLSEDQGPVGSSFDVTAYCASAEPRLDRHDTFTDTVSEVFLTSTDDIEWTTTITADRTDVILTLHCGELDTEATYDVVNPILVPLPVMGNQVTAIAGTDCGTQEAAVTFTAAALTVEVAMPLDPETGIWQVDVPEAMIGEAFEVDATCGELVYGTLVIDAETATTTTTTAPTTSTTVAPPVRPATPAPSVAGRPTYTG